MQHQLETAYIGLESPQPEAIGKYLSDVVGLMPAPAGADGSLEFRADAKAYRLRVHKGPRAGASYIGFEAVDAAAFAATAARLKAAGFTVTQGSAAQIAERGVADLVSVPAPWGVQVELVYGLANAKTAFHSDAFPSGIVTQDQGFGHFVFLTGTEKAYAEARRFAMEGLGLRLSDTLNMPMGPDMSLRVTFLHCNARHHSLALGFAPMPEGAPPLHHINFEVATVRDVGTAYERALRAGTPIANTIGQHANDRMISFYSISPDGWQIEIGATGRVVDDNWSDQTEYDRISDWGHQPPQVLTEMLQPAKV